MRRLNIDDEEDQRKWNGLVKLLKKMRKKDLRLDFDIIPIYNRYKTGRKKPTKGGMEELAPGKLGSIKRKLRGDDGLGELSGKLKNGAPAKPRKPILRGRDITRYRKREKEGRLRKKGIRVLS